MIGQLIRDIGNKARSLKEVVVNLPKAIFGAGKSFIRETTDVFAKLKNLKQVNLQLGLYHLDSGNFSDAILRFRIMSKFFKNDPEFLNLLAISYLLNGNIDKATVVLKKLRTIALSQASLHNYLTKTTDNIEIIPVAIWQHYYPSFLANSAKIRILDSQNLQSEFISLIGAQINQPLRNALMVGADPDFLQTLKEKTKIGNNIAISQLDHSSTEFRLVQSNTDVEASSQATHTSEDENFDLIISFNSLAFARNLHRYITWISSKLGAAGRCVILLPLAHATVLSANRTHFCYELEEIRQWFSESHLSITSEIQYVSEDKNMTYVALIATKTQENTNYAILDE